MRTYFIETSESKILGVDLGKTKTATKIPLNANHAYVVGDRSASISHLQGRLNEFVGSLTKEAK